MKKLENIFLYLVVLGGRAKKANIELHDVRWVVGSKIEDTYDTLRKDWFGSPKGLHIDSYKKIQYIDGHKINLIMNTPNKHIFKIEILAKDKQLLFYEWHVQKASEKNCKDCWFTSGVSMPMDQGNTI